MDRELVRLELEGLKKELGDIHEGVKELVEELRDYQDSLHFSLLTELYNTDNYNIEVTSDNNIRIHFYDNKYNRRERTSALKLFNGQWEQVIYMTGEYLYVLTQEYMTEQKVFQTIKARKL